MESKKKLLYDNIPDDVMKILIMEQARTKIELKKHVSISYVITKLIRKNGNSNLA
jgi:hypothetical protein